MVNRKPCAAYTEADFYANFLRQSRSRLCRHDIERVANNCSIQCDEYECKQKKTVDADHLRS